MKIIIVYFASFFLKTDLAKVVLDKLTEALMLINNRTMKYLRYKIQFDILKYEIRKLI